MLNYMIFVLIFFKEKLSSEAFKWSAAFNDKIITKISLLKSNNNRIEESLSFMAVSLLSRCYQKQITQLAHKCEVYKWSHVIHTFLIWEAMAICI